MSIISVIMPVYNASATLLKSIKSVLDQTADNWELVAIDDGSVDDSWEILKEFASKHSNVCVFKQENQGPGITRNNAISKATGDYVAFLDSDDWWEPDFIEQVSFLIQQDQPDVVFYDLQHENERGEFLKRSNLSKFRTLKIDELIHNQMTGKMEWGMVKVIRRSIIVENEIRFSTDKVGEEAIFSFEVLRNSEKVSFISKPIYHYVLNSNGQHRKGNEDPWFCIVQKMQNHLLSIGELSKYDKTLNSFALRSFMIANYRIATQHSFGEFKKLACEKKKKYLEHFNLTKTNNKYLDRAAILFGLFVRCNWYYPIYIAANLRKKNM